MDSFPRTPNNDPFLQPGPLPTDFNVGEVLSNLLGNVDSSAVKETIRLEAALLALENCLRSTNPQPTAWVGPDLMEPLPEDDHARLVAIAPALSGEDVTPAAHPFTFTTRDVGRVIKGFGFYSEADELIVVASDHISVEATDSNTEPVETTVRLALVDGWYVARDLFTGAAVAFEVFAGTGQFKTMIDWWGTRAFAIVSV